MAQRRPSWTMGGHFVNPNPAKSTERLLIYIVRDPGRVSEPKGKGIDWTRFKESKTKSGPGQACYFNKYNFLESFSLTSTSDLLSDGLSHEEVDILTNPYFQRFK